MKRNLRKIAVATMLFGLILGIYAPAFADNGGDSSKSVNEKLGVPIVVLGEKLTEKQKEETRKLLKVSNDDTVDEYIVTGEDGAAYIGGNPNSNMYSSAKITVEESGKGLQIDIVTQENITEVTNEMYANALLTAGVENATVLVASPVKVSGHSALTGIYKAFDVKGVALDKERMELANEELGIASELAKKEGLSQEKVSELLTEIKTAIAEQNPATKEDVEKIVKEQLDKLEISLNEKDRQLLIDLFEKMRDLNINFDNVKEQLNDIASKVQDKLGELVNDEGFWQNVGNFFNQIFEALSNFIKGLFS
ncbi:MULTISPECIES: DUF1002 domain-containing protein [unclassified Virgibacillus]|uniref:DUF1002 domain-containing protein n=1 Tax=unclassified Virgibacillus TaxID=2620237 RepID=UPI0024DEBB73|nr:DUF1002 domain-containing protein [Virgibacillus sp. LDC-1]